MTRSLVVVILSSLLACKSAPEPAPEPKQATAAEPVDAGPPAPTKPKVTLAAAPALPALGVGLPTPPASADHPVTPEKAELGWKLFFDKRLSKDGSTACVQCHEIARGYTSAAALDTKVGGAANKRNTPTVLNLAFHPLYYWDGRMPTLEAVSNAAWKGQLGADPAAIAQRLNEVPEYEAMFQRAFGAPATADNVPEALAAWLRTLTSGNSAWDRDQAGDAKAMTAEQKEGFKLFGSKGCASCHIPPLFTNFEFENIGVGDDAGRKDATKADGDTGKFKTPSLRNVALTAPYFHDGHAATLDDAIAFMAKGGNANPNHSTKLKAQKLNAKEAKALKAFLESLTGESSYVTEPALP